MFLLRGGAPHAGEGVSADVPADQLRVVQRAEASGAVLSDLGGGVHPPALAAPHEPGGGRPVVRLLRRP